MNIHNSFGFRGAETTIKKPEGVYRIVTIGGSTTYTQGVKDWKKDFARQLERELRTAYNTEDIEVINAGLPGYSTWESLINLQINVLQLEPDLIIIYHAINDVQPRLVNPKDYKGDNSGDIRQWKEAPIPLLFKSTFIRLLTGINPSGLYRFVRVGRRTAYQFDEEGFVERLNGSYMETLEKNPPIYFERNLINMILIAEGNGIDVLLSTWTYRKHFSSGEDYFIPNFISSVERPAFQMAVEEHNEVVKKIGIKYNLPVYDFDSEMSSEEDLWVEPVHLTEKGVDMKAKLFTKYIVSEKLIKR